MTKKKYPPIAGLRELLDPPFDDTAPTKDKCLTCWCRLPCQDHPSGD